MGYSDVTLILYKYHDIFFAVKEQIVSTKLQQHQKPCFEGRSSGAQQSNLLQRYSFRADEALLQQIIPYAKRLALVINILFTYNQ